MIIYMFVDAVEEMEEPAKIYFKELIFSPSVPIRLDYNGKHVDIEQVIKLQCNLSILLFLLSGSSQCIFCGPSPIP